MSVLTPAKDAQSVDHGGMGISSNHTVRVDEALADLHHPGQVLQVDLVDGTHLWRNHVHVLESL